MPLDFSEGRIEDLNPKEKWRALHDRIMILHDNGWTAIGIAEELKISKSTVYRHIEKDEWFMNH